MGTNVATDMPSRLGKKAVWELDSEKNRNRTMDEDLWDSIDNIVIIMEKLKYENCVKQSNMVIYISHTCAYTNSNHHIAKETEMCPKSMVQHTRIVTNRWSTGIYFPSIWPLILGPTGDAYFQYTGSWMNTQQSEGMIVLQMNLNVPYITPKAVHLIQTWYWTISNQ